MHVIAIWDVKVHSDWCKVALFAPVFSSVQCCDMTEFRLRSLGPSVEDCVTLTVQANSTDGVSVFIDIAESHIGLALM